ncbi:PhoD-like phosphatase [Roseateles sp. YR242]|uniref:alkaline phosphatase D family protein n=1 Tax=Roseateles sp. YR242 TaxID=1855305 RepID=UPI0008C9EAA0|nr:alkaline phosphatase D family protein [Roseateles sp. YR242]SEK76635.1 PhoD-like phosphatase [Roseateles sp. YR242]
MSTLACLPEPRTVKGTSMAHLLISAEAPWHRVEQGAPQAGRVPLLTAFRPELGWPRWVLRVPMAWHGGDVYERLPGALQFEPWVAPGTGQPGDPWRTTVALGQFPALQPPALQPPAPQSPQSPAPPVAPDASPDHPAAQDIARRASTPGLLLLAVYLEPRASAVEGAHLGRMHVLEGEELLQQFEGAVLQLLDLPPQLWWQGFVASPQPVDARPLSFALAACQYPPGLLDVSPGCEVDPAQASPAFASMARLHRWARHHDAGRDLSLLLLAGDQIYADASGGLADSRSGIQRYARAFGEFKSGAVRHLPPSVRRVVHSVDDHEIVDNWEPDRVEGVGPWFEVARQAAWDHRWEAGLRVGGPRCLWHDFDWQGGAFFVADARCEREARRVGNWSRARLWSQAQRDAFSAWLGRSLGRPRFLLCGSLPLPRRRTTAEHAASCLRSDAWDGYPHSLHELLREIWRQRANGLVFLSGDEHRSGWISAEISPVDGGGADETVQLHSIHSSALYAPWPFAVTAVEELAAPEVFEFDGPQGRRLRCQVSAWQDHPGDGFAVMTVKDGALHVWFDRAERPLYATAGAPDGPDVQDVPGGPAPCARLPLR